MKVFKFAIFVSTVIFTLSCSSEKHIVYLQDINENDSYDFKYSDYKVKVDDILKIDVLSQSPELSAIFNPKGTANNLYNTKESMVFNGYQVDSKGSISFPSLGKIRVINKSVDEIREKISDLIINRGELLSPIVDVKLLNSYFTILGEVNSPGKHDFLENNLNLLEAIGIAGDLTINGKRNDIKLIREINGSKSVTSIDLTRSEFLINQNFQIFSGDIIIVNPNKTRVKNAGIIGNSGTLLSLLSFILSSIIVISR